MEQAREKATEKARETDWYLDAIRADGTTLAVAARAAGPDTAVPTCPGWTVAGLVQHVGEVHRHKAAIVRDRLQERPDDPPGPPASRSLLDWYEEGLAELLHALAATDPATPVWTWYPPDQTAGFWRRRMAHETAVHRVDAESAGRGPSPVEARLAADGIDEVLTAFMGDDPSSDKLGDRVGTMHVHATDVEGEWLATVHRDALVVAHGHAKADTAVRGKASDLLLWLWGRAGLDRLEVFGDEFVLAGVRALAAEVTR